MDKVRWAELRHENLLGDFRAKERGEGRRGRRKGRRGDGSVRGREPTWFRAGLRGSGEHT